MKKIISIPILFLSLFVQSQVVKKTVYVNVRGNNGADGVTPDTSLIVYKAGSQTITGDKTFTGQLSLNSTTKGLLIYRGNTAQMNAISSPANGLLFTNTDSLNRVFIYTGAGWKGLAFTDEGGGGGSGTVSKAYPSLVISNDSISQRFNVIAYGAIPNDGADDQAAIQAAINACFLAGGGTVYFPLGIYDISGALQTSVSGTNPNSQLYFPSNVLTTSKRRSSITLLGEANNNFVSGYSSLTAPLDTTGVILLSTITGTGTRPSVIGTIGATGNYLDYNYNDISIKNIAVRVYTNHATVAPTMTGINLRNAAKVYIDNVTISTDTITQVTPDPVNSEVAGMILSGVNNSGPNRIVDCWVSGFKYGYIVGEHTTIDNIYAVGNYYGVVIPRGYYTVTGKLLIHACPYGILFPNTTTMGEARDTSYVNLNVESEIDSAGVFSSFWYESRMNVLDSGNLGKGVIRFQNVLGDGTGTVLNNSISLYGGANLNIQDFYGYYRSTQNMTSDLSVGGDVNVVGETSSGSVVSASITGGINANDDITIQGTSNGTKTTSYVNLQPSGGLVGIGNSTPLYSLDIATSSASGVVSFASTSHNNMIYNSGSGFNINQQFRNAGALQWYVGNEGSTNEYRLYNSDANGNSKRFSLAQSGFLTLNAYAAGTIVSDGSGNFTSSSDRRIKHAINDFKYGLAAIMKLRTRTFIYNADSSQTVMNGFIAQEVQEVIPSAVHKANDKIGTLSLETNAILAALVNGMQEQQKQIEELKEEIKKLKK